MSTRKRTSGLHPRAVGQGVTNARLQKAPGYNTRSWAPAKRYKPLIGDGRRSREDGRRTIKVGPSRLPLQRRASEL